MEQHTAVKKMMCELKLYQDIPKSLYPIIRDMFYMMYAVGYDQRAQEVYNRYGKRVGQFDKEGLHLIASFPTVKIAARRTGHHPHTILDSIRLGRPTKADHQWKYLDKERSNPYSPHFTKTLNLNSKLPSDDR